MSQWLEAHMSQWLEAHMSLYRSPGKQDFIAYRSIY